MYAEAILCSMGDDARQLPPKTRIVLKKFHLGKKGHSKLEEVRQLTFRSLNGVDPELVGKFFKHVIDVEKDFRLKEGIQEAVQPFVIPFEDIAGESDSEDEIFANYSGDDEN